MLKRIVTLLFAVSLSSGFLRSPVSGQVASSPLDELTRAAQMSLPLPAAPETSDQSGAVRLVQDCFNLIQISSEEHQRVCTGNVALLQVLASLTGNEEGVTPSQRRAIQFYKSTPPSTGAIVPAPVPPTIPPSLANSSDELRRQMAQALTAEITTVSIRYAAAAYAGGLSKRIEAEARLRVLHNELRKLLGSKSNLLPQDPRACVTDVEVLVKALNNLKAQKRYYDYFAAVAGTSDVRQTVDTLNQEIAELEALIASDQPGQFHRARGEIEAAMTMKAWRQLTATRGPRLAQERKRVESEWRAKYPAILIPNETALGNLPKSASLSEIALHAISAYLLDPVEWASSESKLLTTYTRARQATRTTKTYKQWFASILTPSDLESAILYSKAIFGQSGHFNDPAPFDPKAKLRRYYAELAAALQSELVARKQRRLPAASPAEVPSDPGALKLQRLYTVRLANERYDKLSNMPEELRNIVKATYSEFTSSEFEQAITLFQGLTEHMEKAALSNRPLDEKQTNDLAKARAHVLQTFLRLDEVLDERIREGLLAPNPNTKTVKTIISALKAGRPPTPVIEPGITSPPPDAPTSLVQVTSPRRPPPRGTPSKNAPSLALTDGIFLSAMETAQGALKELKLTFANVRTTPVSVGANKGRLTVNRNDLWERGANFADTPVASNQTRLPKELQGWRGFLNANNKGRPYNYQKDVKNFTSFAPVGGGIHFGDDASLEVPEDLSGYVLSYDDKKQTLVLLGPDNKEFSYGPISPRELKALYRFARSGQNLAISVGWTGHQDTYDVSSNESPVLLDPAFVDTTVGMNLFQADSIPWELDRNLPNGATSPIALAFKRADEERISQSVAPLLPLLRGIAKFEDMPKGIWRVLFDANNPNDALVQSVIFTTGLEQAKLDYLTRTGVRELIANQPPGIELTAEESKSRTKYLNEVGFGLYLLNELYEKDHTGRYLLRALASRMNMSGNVELKWVKLWAALTFSAMPKLTSAELAQYFLAELPYTTIAVLLDEPTTIQLQNGKIILKGSMRYRYATTRVMIDQERVVVGVRLPKGTSQVRDLRELTQLANDALPKLMALYPPLERTAEYARLTSFLRWAGSKGRLMAIDLSSLASYAASDRANTPTPDAVTRR